MSYIVNVHYKTDPEDLFWQYSGMTHTCLHNAVNELISAQKQPHIDKAIVAGSGTGQPIDKQEIVDRAVADAIVAMENLVTACEKIALVPVVTNYGAVVYASGCDMIEHNEVKGEQIIHELEHVIHKLKEDIK